MLTENEAIRTIRFMKGHAEVRRSLLKDRVARVTETDTDEVLLEKARSGNQDAFLLLYQRHVGSIFRFLYRLVGSAEIAEDIAHGCFLSLIRSSEESCSSAPASLRTCLYSTARTRAMQYLKNSGQTAVAQDTVKIDASPKTNKLENQSYDGQLVSDVAEAVAGLPALEREALILSEYEGLLVEEIAAIVGADIRTLAGRIENARKRLRSALEKHL